MASSLLVGWVYFTVPLANTPSFPIPAATYVANYISFFQTSFGVPVSYVGIWNSPTAVTAGNDAQISYIKTLRTTLDASSLGAVAIVCADQSDWSCADAAAADPALASAIDVIGNAGLSPSSTTWNLGLPVWSTSFGKTATTSARGIRLSADIAKAYIDSNGKMSGFIYSYGASANPYGFPR